MTSKHLLIVGVVMAIALSCAQSGQPGEEPEAAPQAAVAEAADVGDAHPRRLTALGTHSMRVTSNAEAQGWFDQGLALVYGFNHAAAIEAFAKAASIEPSCAMCSWGQGLAYGPNINAPMGPEAGKLAYELTQQALAASANAAARDRALIEALAKRYAPDPESSDRAALDLAYAEAMQGVAAAYPEDDDVAVLLAESLMDLYPWNYWEADGQPREHTGQIVSLIEIVLARNPEHLGANHYYIHATEEFFPEKAEPAADRLASLAPDAGHLVHMPSHIYWRVGRYDDAVEVNREAAAADERFFAWCRPGAFYRAAYYPHNIHFLWAASATGGQSEAALIAARKLAAETKEALASFDFMQEFQAIPVLTLVRFGRFDSVLGEPMPPSDQRYVTGIFHYSRGLARLRSGSTEEAAAELAALRAVIAEPATQELILAGGTSTARQLLEIGEAHLDAEILAASGDATGASESFELAVTRQDDLAYMEPPPWYAPPRQYYGAQLLAEGRNQEAEAVYRKDLEKYPKNGWSLFGLAQSLRAQGRTAEADAIDQGFSHAFANSDVTLERSHF